MGDILIVALLLISAVLAMVRGFIREMLAIAAWLGAAAVAIYTFPYASPWVREQIGQELIADFIAGVSLFVISLIVLSILFHFLAKLVRGRAVNAVDRSLGFLFGLLRGAVLVCLAYLLLVWLFPDIDRSVVAGQTGPDAAQELGPDGEPVDQWRQIVLETRSLPLVRRGALVLRGLIPESYDIAGLEGLTATPPPSLGPPNGSELDVPADSLPP